MYQIVQILLCISDRNINIISIIIIIIFYSYINKYYIYLISVEDIVTVSITQVYGLKLASLVDQEINVLMNISLGQVKTYNLLHDITHGSMMPHTHKNTTMVGISLCLVGVLLVGIVLLLIYIVRRARYMNARNAPRMVRI